MPDAKTYHFHEVERCVMCGADGRRARVLGLRLNTSQGRSPRQKTGIAVSICKCSQCGLHFPQPLPVPSSMSDHYGVPPESYWKDAYFNTDPNYFSRQIADAKRLLDFRDGMRALDIGVGIGKAVKSLRAAGFDVWGMEPSKPFYDKALEWTGMGADRLALAGVEEAEYPENFFDFITFGAVLEHLYDPGEAIRRAMHWLKPGGVIQAEVPSSKHLMASLLNVYYRLLGTSYVTNLSPMHSPYHLYEFTVESFVLHGKSAGYELAHHYIDVASIRHVPSAVKPALHWLMDRGGSGMQLTVWLRKKAPAA